jgi:pyrimidine dimer DNA glycosylase
VRLWTLHPRYLDARGLVALWREALLAQAVLRGKTRGYRHHPQLDRFLDTASPVASIAAYLRAVHAEARCRGYRFDGKKIARSGDVRRINAARGQLGYEWKHLRAKLRRRDPSWLAALGSRQRPDPHPLFRTVPGGVADWEIVVSRKRAGRKTKVRSRSSK